MRASSMRRPAATAAAVALVLTLAPGVVASPPDNDSWVSPTAISGLPFATSVDLTEATAVGDPGTCWGGDRTVWYSFTPTSTLTVQVNLSGSPDDASLSIYAGSPWYLTSCADPFFSTRLTMSGETTYYFQLATSSGSSTAQFEIAEVIGPANDQAAGAETIFSLPMVIQPDFTPSTMTGDPPLCGGSWYGSLWYRYTPPETQLVTFELAPTATDAAVGFAVGTPPFNGVNCIGTAFWGAGPMPLWLEGGQDYYILFAAGAPDPNISLTIDLAPPAPPNDNRADATLVSSLPFEETVNTWSATSEGEEPYGCFSSDSDIWYAFMPDGDVTLDVDLTASAGPAGADVFLVRETSFEHLGCTEDQQLRKSLVAGETYLVRVSSFDVPRSVTVAFREGPPPLDVAAQVSPSGTINRVAGAVTISGTAWCNTTADSAWLYVQVRQRVGRLNLITGEADVDVACDPSSPKWTIKVNGSNGPFGVGSIAVTWSVSAEVSYDYDSAQGDTTVRIKGAR